jgi:predicted nucleic acid-binding protein
MYKVVIDPNIWISFLIGKKLKDLIKTYCVDDSVENIIVPALRDNDDLYLLALAKAVGANILLTGDSDLLTLKRYNQIEIISFSEFMTRLL